MGAPSGLAPVAFAPSALARRVPCRSFYLDLGLLEDYWVRRKYHHTISASLVYALHEALNAIDEEGLEARWARHERHHQVLAAGLEAMGLGLLPPEGERLWTLNAVRVPDGVDEARARRDLLARFNMEVGAGLGPLAGKIWRVGLMGHSSSTQAILLFLGAMEACSARRGIAVPPGRRTAAAIAAIALSLLDVPRHCRSPRFGRMSAGEEVRQAVGRRARRAPWVSWRYVYLTLPDVASLATVNPPTTAFIELRAREARAPRRAADARPAVGARTAASRGR